MAHEAIQLAQPSTWLDSDLSEPVVIASITNTIIPSDRNRLRLALSSSRATSASWVTGAFTITAGGGIAIPAKVSVTPSGDPATYMDLVTELQKDGAAYTLAWTGLVGITNGSSGFTGDADLPTIVDTALQSYDKTTRTSVYRLTFSRVMSSTGLSATTDYSVAPVGNGRKGRVTAVALGSPLTYVDLTVRGMEPGRQYAIQLESP